MLCLWSEPLKSVQIYRCALSLRCTNPDPLLRAWVLEFKLTRLLATCGASRLFPASFVLIRDSIADLGCASGESWTVSSQCVRSSCLSTLVHLALVGTVEIYVEGQ